MSYGLILMFIGIALSVISVIGLFVNMLVYHSKKKKLTKQLEKRY